MFWPEALKEKKKEKGTSIKKKKRNLLPEKIFFFGVHFMGVLLF